MGVFGLVFLGVALVLIGAGIAVGLVACTFAVGLLALGVISTSIFRRRSQQPTFCQAGHE